VTGLSPRAAALAAAIAGRSRKRVPLDELWRLFVEVDHGPGSSVDRRRRLADDLAELVAAGLVTPARTLDDTRQPPLPRFVERVVERARPGRARPRILHPRLSWADALPSPTPAQTRLLDAVNAWLFDPGHDTVPLAPLRERALEITGDEKAFDSGSLIGPGRITPALVRAYRVVVPLHTASFGAGPVLLVVENSDTFDSLRRALDGDPGRVGAIGWGAGAAFEASVLSVRDRHPAVAEVRYFGDLDAAGLRIPASASRLAVQEGLPPVRPATGLYRELLAVGRPAATRAVSGSGLPDLLDWLDEPQRAPVRDLLAGGQRMAQEAVTLAHLTRPGHRAAHLVG
jgi:hypothetical protein